MPTVEGGHILDADALNAYAVKFGPGVPSASVRVSKQDGRSYIAADGRIYIQEGHFWKPKAGKDGEVDEPTLRSLGRGPRQAAAGQHTHYVDRPTGLDANVLTAYNKIVSTIHVDEETGLRSTLHVEFSNFSSWNVDWSGFDTSKSMLVIVTAYLDTILPTTGPATPVNYTMYGTYGEDVEYGFQGEVVSIGATGAYKALIIGTGIISEPTASGQLTFRVERSLGVDKDVDLVPANLDVVRTQLLTIQAQ